MHIILTALLAACSLFFSALLPAEAAIPTSPTDPAAITTAPNYASPGDWLVLPGNPDEYPVDVFWVYPTVLSDDVHWVMDIHDPAMRSAAMNTILVQASVFEGQANIYAPMYRQVNMQALSLPESQSTPLFAAGKSDIEQAFQYYLDHYNKGRPFILAGHSQGSQRLTELAVKIWGSSPKHKQLVAAYVIGWSIVPEDLAANPAVKICEEARQTGCFIAWNSVAPGMQSQAPTLKPGTAVVNPLTWKADGEPGPASMNLGAVFFNDDGTYEQHPNFASAQVVDYGLVVIPSDPALLRSSDTAFPDGVYHVYDYSLFYQNLRANVAERIRSCSGTGSGTGCMLNPTAGFGMEGLLILMIPALAAIKNRSAK